MSKVRPLSRTVERRRYKRAKKLLRMMQRRRVRLFEPCLLRYRGEEDFTLVLPPVVERTVRAGRAVGVVVDGVHRLTALSRYKIRKYPTVSVIVVAGDSLPRLAATPGEFDEIEVVVDDPKRSKKFRRLRPRLFRPAGEFLRSEHFRFRSVDEFVVACTATASNPRMRDKGMIPAAN